jgi:chromosome segregation ATPase
LTDKSESIVEECQQLKTYLQ